jgi:hypothetical protein
MAQVRLERHEAEYGYLPPVCMCCGGEAVCQRRKHFRQTTTEGTAQSWLITPLCESHRWHFTLRKLAIPLTLAAVIITFVLGLILVGIARVGPQEMKLVLLAGGIGFVGWIVLTVYLHYTGIRADEVGSSMLVAGVSDAFVEALGKHRQAVEREKPLYLDGAGPSRRQVRLFRSDTVAFPDVCIFCGEPACDYEFKKWTPKVRKEAKGIELVVAVIIVLLSVGHVWMFTRDKDGQPWDLLLPVCQKHRPNWWRRNGVTLIGFLIPGMIFLVALTQLAGQLQAILIVTSVISFIVWGFASAFRRETGLKAAEMTEDMLVLRAVSADFVEAVEDLRRRRAGLGAVARVVQSSPREELVYQLTEYLGDDDAAGSS